MSTVRLFVTNFLIMDDGDDPECRGVPVTEVGGGGGGAASTSFEDAKRVLWPRLILPSAQVQEH